MPRGKLGVHTFNQVAYNKENFVRVPLDLRVPMYNALSDYAKMIGVPINTLLKSWITENVPKEVMEAHKNDIEKKRL